MRRALELLSEAARDRLRLHPQGHLAGGAREGIELAVPVPLSSDRDADRAAVEGAARSLEGSIAAAIDGLLLHRSRLPPGPRLLPALRKRRVRARRPAVAARDLRRLRPLRRTPLRRLRPVAGRAPRPAGRRPVLERLPRRRPRHRGAAPGEELTAQLLDVYRDRTAGYRLHGQVSAGFYRVADQRGHETPITATFQIVSSRPEGNRRRYSLNVLALGPGGEPPEHLFDRLGQSPWGAQVRWAASVLDSIERSVAKKGRRKKAEAAAGAERRIEGLIESLARRLEKGKRAQARRTKHAAERHDQGDRPTRMALADLAAAKDEDVLLDTQRRTFIVLGEKGRAHVFNRQGKLVTSIRYAPDAIERRREKGRWKPLPAVEITALRTMVEGEQAAAGHGGGPGGG